jgi:hypothetical protein
MRMDTRIEAKLEKDGTLTLEDVPFHAGEVVQVTITPKPDTAAVNSRQRLRGTPVSYLAPFEPVAAEDWESAR